MSRTWFLCGLLTVAGLGARIAAQEAAPIAPSPVEGSMVDSDMPATYRLPAVPVPESAAPRVAVSEPQVSPPPSAEIRVAELPAAPREIDSVEELFATVPQTPPPTAATGQLVEHVFAPQQAITPLPAANTAQLLPAVQRGYTLAQRGALFAARTEFVQVLRRVAQAHDAANGSDERARALAAGLRALDEAEDFMPSGIQLEAELDVTAVASSHRTAILSELGGEKVLPQEALKLYHTYAQQQLALVAGGDQAGSMSLYGLGRIYAQLSDRHDDDAQCISAMTMYAAALDACPTNHLAANELGVLKSRTGHPDEAARLFERALDMAPNATTYHNLAITQQKLGFQGEAFANEQEAQRLAAWERSQGGLSKRAGIQWVTPAEMARASQTPTFSPATPPIAHAGTPVPQPTPVNNGPAKSAWEKTVGLKRLLPRFSPDNTSMEAINRAETPVARRPTATNDTHWR